MIYRSPNKKTVAGRQRWECVLVGNTIGYLTVFVDGRTEELIADYISDIQH